MNSSNNFYKIDHRYNKRNSDMCLPFQHSAGATPSTTSTKVNNRSSTMKAMIDKFEKPQRTSQKSSVALSSSPASYQEKISQILTHWQQLQKEKKVCQEKQQPPPSNEFDRIMEEVLEHQLQELEREEEKQSKSIERIIDEQLENEHQIKLINSHKEDHLTQLHELKMMFDECHVHEKSQASNKVN